MASNAIMHNMKKKPQKGAVALATAQEQLNFPKPRLLTPFSTRFTYLIH